MFLSGCHRDQAELERVSESSSGEVIFSYCEHETCRGRDWFFILRVSARSAFLIQVPFPEGILGKKSISPPPPPSLPFLFLLLLQDPNMDIGASEVQTLAVSGKLPLIRFSCEGLPQQRHSSRRHPRDLYDFGAARFFSNDSSVATAPTPTDSAELVPSISRTLLDGNTTTADRLGARRVSHGDSRRQV